MDKKPERFNETKIKNYNENSNKQYFFEVDVEYPKHNDLPFWSERMKINKYQKLIYNIYDNQKYVIQIRALKKELNQALKLKKVYRVVKFNQKHS